MIIISHRANLDGSNPSLENKPSQIEKCLNLGLSVEVDIRYDNGWWLGHDEPKYKISYNWIINCKHLWLHCKDINTLHKLTRRDNRHIWNDNLNYFWHQNDDYTLTSKGNIWTCKKENLNKNCVLMWANPEFRKLPCHIYGICTDYSLYYKKYAKI